MVGKVDGLTLTIIALTVGADLTATPTVPFTYSYSLPVKFNDCLPSHRQRQASGVRGRRFTGSGFAKVGLRLKAPRVRKLALPGV